MEERNTADNTQLHLFPTPTQTEMVFILGTIIYHELFNGGGGNYWFRGSSKIIYDEQTKFTSTLTENVGPCYRYSIKYSSKIHTVPAQ